MVDVFLRKKSKDRWEENVEGSEQKVWEQTQDWSNPFDNEENSTKNERREEQRKRRETKKKRKTRRHRHHGNVITEEEYTVMSSKADSMLDDLLGGDGGEGLEMPRVPEEQTLQHGKGSNPFDDSEEEEVMDGQEINRNEYAALMSGQARTVEKTSKNPFVNDIENEEELPDCPDCPELNDEDDSIIAPPTNAGNNPFEDSSIAGSAVIAETPITTARVVITSVHDNVNTEDLKRQSTETTEEHEHSESSSGEEDQPEEEAPVQEEEEEDIVESSKRLLRMADKRLQYQQHNDEVRKLKEIISGMNHQAEAMSEQLRRAIETKCDLVLAQTEMERCHEQDLIAKDDEVRDMRLYIQELLDSQANNELHFMNEISSLSKKVDEMATKQREEIMRKDFTISQLQAKVNAMRTESVLAISPREAFRSRFIEGTGPIMDQTYTPEIRAM